MNKQQMQARLDSYWRLELFNAAALPVAAVAVGFLPDYGLGLLSVVCLVPMTLLLIVGGLYWRGKAFQLMKDGTVLPKALRLADGFQRPTLVLVVVACLLCAVDGLAHKLSVSYGDRLVARIATTLAVLEYVNYYHRQLQHFDHLADFRRLVNGQGFRKSQMSHDLHRYRQADAEWK